jgi:ABC-2 type transport system permease protein
MLGVKNSMNLTRIMALVNKDIKKTVREPAALFLTLLFPVMLMLFFGLAFGRAGGESTYQVGVVNLDAGGPQSRWSGYFLGNLTSVGVIRTVEYAANETAQADLSQGNVQAVLIIPSGFGQSCSSFWTAADPSLWVRASVQLYLDSGSMFATQAIPPIVQQALEATIRGPQRTTAQLPVELASPSLVASAKLTAFDYMAPGVFAFATIFLVLIVSSSFTVEREEGLLRRINTTPATPSEFMTAASIANMISALAQGLLLFVMSLVVGFHSSAGLTGTVMAFAILMVFSLCNVGFGLITATLSKSSGAANGISFIFVIPQMFFGTFVGAALPPDIQVLGRLVPSYYVTDALTSLLLRGAPWTGPTILLDLAVVSAYSVIVLILGVLLFRKYGKSQ